MVAQLLYLSKSARPDIQLTVSFLCTRVRGDNTDDYKNLARATKYIQGTIGLLIITSINKSVNIKLYVDAEFAVQKDTRSHTGGLIAMGIVGAYVQSRKQNLNITGSTKSEIVGIDDVLNQVIWTRYLLKDQVYNIHNNIIYQDNQRATKLEKNGRQSISKMNRHIHIRYYCITDRITKQD